MNYQDGYSQKALDALAKGKYKSLRSSGLANYRYTEGKKKRDNIAVAKQNKTQNPTPRNTNAMANDPRFFAPSVSLPVPTLPMVNAMQGDPRFQVQPEYNGDEVLNQLLGSVQSPVKESSNLSDMIPGNDKKVKSPKKEQKQTDKVAEIMGSFDPTTPVKVTKPEEKAKKRSMVKPATRYKNEPAMQKTELPQRDTTYDKEFAEYWDARFANHDIRDYDPETDRDIPHWQNVKKDIMQKHGWTEEEFEKNFTPYNSEQWTKMSEDEVQGNIGAADKSAALGALLNTMYLPQAMVEGASGIISNLTGYENPDFVGSDPYVATRSREGMKTAATKDMGTVGSTLYNIGLGQLDRAVASQIPIFGTAALGAETAGRTLLNAEERGVDDTKAGLQALGSGIASGFFNKIGFNKMAEGGSSPIGNILKGAAAEGAEEGAEDLFNIGLDTGLNLDKSELATLHDYYVGQGMSSKQAWLQVAKDKGIDLATSIGTSALFGGLFSTANEIPELKTRLSNVIVDKAKSKKVEANDAARLARAEIEAEAQANINRGPDVVEQAKAQAERAQAEIERLNEQLPEMPESTSNVNTMQNVDFKPSIHNADGQLLDTVKVPEYTADSNVFFNGSDTDIAFAEAQDAAITDTFRNIVSDPEFNALSFKNGRQEVYVSPSTNGEGYRVSYTVDGVPTGHHDYSINEIDDLSQNLREMAGNGGEDIRIQKKSDLARQTAERPFTDMSPEEQSALQSELDNEYNFDANEVAANDTGIDSNPRITERSPFPEKADGSRPDYHNVEEVGTRLETTRQSIAKNTEDIEALNKQLNDIPDLKKNAKERSALKNQIYQLEQQNKQSAKLEKILTKISDGEKVSNKDIFEVEFPDDYNAIFDGRGGFFGRVNMATKFAGDTPEAKALAQSIRDDIYAIAKGDFDIENLGGLLEKVYNLDRMAQETKADYRARGTGKNPSRVYKYDDFFAGTKNGIGDDFTSNVIHSLDKAYQIANNMTDIDTTPRVTEAVGGSAPVETPESVVAASNPTVPEVTNDTGIDNRVPTAEQTPVETNRVPAVEQTTPANGDEKIRSFSERGSQDDTLPDEIRESLSEDKYRVVRNADVETRANELFDPDNLIQSRSNLKQAIDNHDPAAALLSYKLAKAYVDGGEYDVATDVIKEASAELTKSGQFTQAAKLAMMQNDPMAAMRSYMKDLEDLNKWGKKKYGKKWKELELSEEDVSEFGKVTPGDAENLNNLVNKLNNKFGKEVHASFWDKVVGATKTSMLLNIRTQMRNIVSNTAMLPVRSISDRVSALGQNIAHLINPNIEVTQSLVGGTRAQKQAAGELFESMKDSILGTNKMKDSNTADIHGHRQIFNDDFFARWIDNKTNGGIQKLNERLGADGNQSTMETLQNFTYWLMGDFGDTPFVKKNFENRLASYMKAQNIDNIKDVPDDAIALAIEESLKATFKDDNAFTKALQGVKQKTGKFGEIALPFVKTPANLAMRSIDYSPIGLINTFRKAKNGAEVNQVIDELAKNLTGTAMIYLGYKLREKGLLSGNYSEDKDEAAFQKQQGMLEHAFHIGDKYFTYDWLQPAAAPLEIGSVIFDAINNSDKENAGVLDALNSSVKGGLAVANSWIQSSPLQSLSDMLGNNPYGDEGVAENVLNEVMEFPQRLIPAQLGAIARSVDPTIRDTYIKDNTLTGIAGNQARQIVAKIPYLSKTLPASYDTWGNERTRTDTKWGGALAQNVNPGQLGNKNETPLDSEIQRLFDVTGRGEVFPISASRSLTLGEETVNMTNKEHSEYQKMMGEQSYEMADTFMNSAAYKDMTDEERVNTLDSIYKLSNSIAKEKIFNYATDSDKELKEIYKAKGAQAAVDYLTQKSEAKNLGMSFSTYQKKEAEYEGGAEQYAQDKQTALDNGFVKSDGTANPDQYKKVMEQAGEHADKVLNDIPTLQSSGLPTSSYYTYAQAVNVVPSLSPSEFASTYKAIDTNPENAITQTEILEYINKKGYSQDQLEAVQDLWDMYKPSNSKKVPYLKDGIWKAKSK